MRWFSEGAKRFAAELDSSAPWVLDAVAELDHLGHRVLTAAQEAGVPTQGRRMALHLLRRAVATYAGVRALLERSTMTPLYVVSRAQFELMLQVKALVCGTADTVTANYRPDEAYAEQRGRFYAVWEHRADIYLLQQTLDHRALPAERRAELEAAVAEEITLLETKYAVEHAAFGPMRFTLAGTKKRYHDKDQWYTLALPSQPSTIAALADALGFGAEHDLFYSPLSRHAHGVGSRADIWYEGNGLAVRHPHDNESLPFLCRWTAKWQADSLSILATYCCPASIPDIAYTLTELNQALVSLGNTPPYTFR